MPKPSRLALMIVLLLAGFGLFVWTGGARIIPRGPVMLAVLAVVCATVRPLARLGCDFADRFERMGRRRHAAFVVVFGLMIAFHLLYASVRGGRYWVPQFHDEQMYLLQARQMASFHLAMPALPFPEHFESFYIFTTPVYASMYFPGTALAYVPSIWLNLPWVAWPVVISTLALLMTYLVAARMLGRLAGVVSVLCVLGTIPMNFVPTMTLSHPLGALLGMSMVYAFLRWRDKPGFGWAVVFGVAAGWMAITRPLESLAFGVPLAVGMLATIRPANTIRILSCATAAAVCTLPFLALQLAFDHAVTGSYTKLPIAFYNEKEFPNLSVTGTNLGDDPFKTTSTLPQKKLFAETFLPINLRQSGTSGWHVFKARGQEILFEALPSLMLCVVLPLSLVLVTKRLSWAAVWAIPACYGIGYQFYGAYLSQYTIQIAPVLVILSLAGGLAVTDWFPTRAVKDGLRFAFILVPATLALTALVRMPNNGLAAVEWDLLQANYVDFPENLRQPALLFIKFGQDSNPHVELVYNIETAWPDDAKIVRMHDLGAKRNLPVLEYYAERQPGRFVYQFDRETRKMTYMGNVRDVVAKLQAAAATQPLH